MTKKRKNRTVSLWVIKLQGEKQEAGSRRRKARKGERGKCKGKIGSKRVKLIQNSEYTVRKNAALGIKN
jgi:hypothetical protein